MARYRVKPGETVESLAERHKVSPEELYQKNERTLTDAARARGHEPVTYRTDAEGKRSSVYAVFADEELEVPDEEESKE